MLSRWLAVERCSVMVAETELAAGERHVGTQAQAGDIRAAPVAHLGDQRQVLKADRGPLGVGGKSQISLQL